MSLTTDIRQMQRIQATWISGVLPNRDVRKTCIKLCSEAAEVAESVGYLGQRAVASELADALILLLDIAELCDIDIVHAFHTKMEVNRNRTWLIGDGCIKHSKESAHGHQAHESRNEADGRASMGNGQNRARSKRTGALSGSWVDSFSNSYAYAKG